MENILIPAADTVPVAWGWFQFLLLLTFPLHLLAMNGMLGGLAVGVVQHLLGGGVRRRLAYRLAIITPLLIALTVNLGVAPYLFLQVLYGQFLYTSSILMGIGWILIVPLLMLAYYGAYVYDFHFERLGYLGLAIAALCVLGFLVIAAMLSGNMLLMVLPERFAEYFRHMDGSLFIAEENSYAFRYLHMVLGALAVGGLAVALAGRFRAERDLELAEHAEAVGLRVFMVVTAINILVGVLYLLSLPRAQMLLFMGRDMGATVAFGISLLLTVGVMITAWRRKLWLTIGHAVALVYVMAFLRSWLRSGYLRQYFTLDQLQVIPQYSPMLFFFAVLVFGLFCLFWLWRKTAETLART